ncbi:stage III sporulation protein AF [Niallia sp. Krafla_26]|uniref:stage III sporulation protein AF n=1 Tax=Niallia sp. Krafla_26 TaxID=3064703 RepID=UPI003D16EAC1
MEFIKEWVTNIILFVLFATLIDMLLPNSKFQKYTKMVVGLLLISVILTPIFKLLSTDFEESFTAALPQWEEKKENEIKNLIDLQKNEIQASHDAYILEQMAVQLKEDAEEELMDQFDVAIADLEVVVDEEDVRPFPENLQKVVIQLNGENEEAETEAVEVVKSVEINTNEPLQEETKFEHNDRIIKLLANKWSIDEEIIELQLEGGDKEQ